MKVSLKEGFILSCHLKLVIGKCWHTARWNTGQDVWRCPWLRPGLLRVVCKAVGRCRWRPVHRSFQLLLVRHRNSRSTEQRAWCNCSKSTVTTAYRYPTMEKRIELEKRGRTPDQVICRWYCVCWRLLAMCNGPYFYESLDCWMQRLKPPQSACTASENVSNLHGCAIVDWHTTCYVADCWLWLLVGYYRLFEWQ